MVRFDVFSYDRAAADHGMIPNFNAREYCGVIGKPRSIANSGRLVVDRRDVVKIMAVRVDVHVIGHRNIIPYLDPAPIVEQHMPVDDDIVAKREVVAKGPLNEVPALKVCSDALEDEGRQHPM